MLQALLPQSAHKKYVYHLQSSDANFHTIYHHLGETALNHHGILEAIHIHNHSL